MRVIVFGGSGFIGGHVADILTELGHKVVIFDKKGSPYIKIGQEMIIGDILDEKLVENTLRKHSIEIIYNFAGISDLDECSQKPVETAKYNILGNIVLLEAARKMKIKRFLFASSVYVYSDSGSFYKTSKQSCELFIENYHKIYNLPYTILRYGSLYGDRANEENSIYKYIKDALKAGKIIYYGTGEERREYIHVKDAAKLSVMALDPGYENQHIMLTGNESMLYKDLLEMIKEMLGGKIEIIYKKRKNEAHYKMTPYTFNPKLGRKLVCNPHIDMGQGLLYCMKEIYEKTHGNLHEEMGIMLDDKNIEIKMD